MYKQHTAFVCVSCVITNIEVGPEHTFLKKFRLTIPSLTKKKVDYIVTRIHLLLIIPCLFFLASASLLTKEIT